jgi:tetratricopeptide (TPR) repeat protein
MTKDKPNINNLNDDLFQSEKTDTSPKSISSSILFTDNKKKLSNGIKKIRNLSESTTCLHPRKSSLSLEDDFIYLNRKSSITKIISSSVPNKQNNDRNQSSFRKFLSFLQSLRQFFKFSVIIVISILINSLYFNFYYLPSLNHYNSINNNNNHHESISNDQKAKLPYIKTPFESYNQKFDVKSYDHVAFASFDNFKHSNENNDFLSRSLLDTIGITDESTKNIEQTQEKRRESQMALNIALTMYKEGKFEKAAKIYKYALSLDPNNYDALTSYGEYLENHKKDIIKAEHLYNRVIRMEPTHDKAAVNLKRALPLVNKLDRKMLDKLDMLLKKFYDIPSTSAALKRAKKEAYFMHIYHSNVSKFYIYLSNKRTL